MAKLPEPPPVARLRNIPPEIKGLAAGTELWRLYFRAGRYPGAWNRFRDFGPLRTARFDHHQAPPRVQARGILSAAAGPRAIVTAIAEVFQDTRVIDPQRGAPWLAGFALARDVNLLDLTRTWPTRAGASMAINSGPRPRAQRWSRSIFAAYPEIGGLHYASSMYANRPAVALYERAQAALPSAPLFHAALTHPALFGMLRDVAVELGYDMS